MSEPIIYIGPTTLTVAVPEDLGFLAAAHRWVMVARLARISARVVAMPNDSYPNNNELLVAHLVVEGRDWALWRAACGTRGGRLTHFVHAYPLEEGADYNWFRSINPADIIIDVSDQPADLRADPAYWISYAAGWGVNATVTGEPNDWLTDHEGDTMRARFTAGDGVEWVLVSSQADGGPRLLKAKRLTLQADYFSPPKA